MHALRLLMAVTLLVVCWTLLFGNAAAHSNTVSRTGIHLADACNAYPQTWNVLKDQQGSWQGGDYTYRVIVWGKYDKNGKYCGQGQSHAWFTSRATMPPMTFWLDLYSGGSQTNDHNGGQCSVPAGGVTGQSCDVLTNVVGSTASQFIPANTWLDAEAQSEDDIYDTQELYG